MLYDVAFSVMPVLVTGIHAGTPLDAPRFTSRLDMDGRERGRDGEGDDCP